MDRTLCFWAAALTSLIQGLSLAYGKDKPTQVAVQEDLLVKLEKDLVKDPYNLQIYSQLAREYLQRGFLDQGERIYFHALALNPNFIDLAFGQEIGAWSKSDHWTVGSFKFTCPLWEGQPLTGKSIAVYAKKGFGDTIQFARFVEALVKKGAAKIYLLPQKGLETLFRDSFAAKHQRVIEVLDAGNDLTTLSPDYHVPLLGLPHALDLHVNEIPKEPYLNASSALVKKYREVFAQEKSLKVGIVWTGDPSHIYNPVRAVPLARFVPLLQIPNVRLYSLQKGAGEDQLKQLPEVASIKDLSPLIKTYADTAALIKNLDLVITTDTSVVHLAGALGCPTLLLLCKETDMKWASGQGTDNLWYKSVKTLRQKEQGQWDSVFSDVQNEVRARANKKGGSS